MRRLIMLKSLGLCGFGLFAAALNPASAADVERPTFFKDVLPILQTNCQECHRPSGTNYGGMLAPMSLVTYREARPWAKAIAKQVTQRTMPPWDAAIEHRGVFSNERSLTDEEIAILNDWVKTGASRGNPSDAPEPVKFDNEDGWMIGEPDLIVTMAEPYFVDDDVVDLYTAFNVDLTLEQLPEDVWITAFQCKPDSGVVHHFNCMLLAPVDGKLPLPAEFTDTDAGEIAPSRAGAGQYIGGVASGTDANVYPEGFGLPLKKGSRVTFDVHFHKEPGPGTGVWDQSAIGFKLTSIPPTRKLGGGPRLLTTFNLNIPPGDSHFQVGPISSTIKRPIEIVSLMPHMHLRGTEAKFEAFYPDGTSEVLLHVPEYDFSWQTVYYFNEMKRIPADTRIEYTAWYDNSEAHAAVQNFDATKTVKFGPKSTDEMMMGFMMSAEIEEPEESEDE